MRNLLILFGVLLLAASCEKDPDYDKIDANLAVYTDHDKATDFTKFKTYYLPDSILEASSRHASYWKDENAQELISTVASNMDKMGYKRITDPKQKDNADIGLQMSYVAQNTQVVTGGDFGGWWDYGFWGPWWGGWYYPYPVVYSYDTNALIIEMVDLSANNDGKEHGKLPVVWYASASGFNYSSRYNQKLLTNAIDQAFSQSAYLNKSNTENK